MARNPLLTMPHRLARGALVLVVLAAAVLGPKAGRAAEPVINATLQHGPFEIVASGRRISSGAFPNLSANPFATMEVTTFVVRWHGKEISVPGVGTHFSRVLRLLDSSQPALLVLASDFQLVTESAGQLVVRSFANGSSDMSELQWLDSEHGQPGPVQVFGIQRVELRSGTELGGGRWLRLGHQAVLDVRTLSSHAVRPWIESAPPGQALAGLNASNGAAIAFSPGATQFVVPASEPSQDREGLVVVDILSGQAYAVATDRQRMRYADLTQLDAAWVGHYFEWQRDAQGRERLTQRSPLQPLPWRGRFVDFRDHVEYRVAPVKPEMAAELARVAIERLGARPVPDPADPRRSDSYAVPGCDHLIAISQHDDQVGLYVPVPKVPPWVRCQDALRRLGQAFDLELATGRLDRLFVTR